MIHLTELYAAADRSLIELPRRVADARARLAAAETSHQALTAPAPADEAGLARALARGDVDLDSAVAAIDEAERAIATHSRRATLTAAALRVASGDVDEAVRDASEQIVTEQLAPAHARTVGRFRAALAAIAPHGNSPQALLTAPAAARRAWGDLDDAAADYALLRAVRSRLVPALMDTVDVRHDDAGLYAEIRNPHELWPEIVKSHVSPAGRPAPWSRPTAREQLTAILELGGEPWCPTLVEQETAWVAVFGARLEAGRRGRAELEGWRHAFAG